MATEAVPFTIGAPLERGDLPGLCGRVCRVLACAGAGTVLCDVGDLAADAVAVDALARLQLAARRRGCRVVLRHAAPGLRELVALMGLSDVLTE